ncbi:ferric reduction oxidase 8 [Euphorbia peplus]|nr:ferric reduction oxidase 8 [Euphorbia peplus]
MVSKVPLVTLRLFMIFIFCAWVSIWLLKPTKFWTTKWKKAEDFTRPTVFGYYGLDFAVYTFPIITLAITGLVYLNLLSKVKPRIRQARTSNTGLSNPVIINSFIGILSGIEILAVFCFLAFLVWTFYARISNDFKKLLPAKSLNLNLWQLKYLKVATRFGLLAEACLALLLLPILRGLALFQLLGIQFEASVRYHVWLGTSMILFATVHGVSTLFIWGVSHNIQDEIWRWQKTGRIYLAGEIALVTALVIWITSLPQIRRRKFEIFYYTHHLYIVFLVFFLFHAGDRHFYAVFPGIFLFGLDKLLRIVQSRPESCILSAKVFPNKTVELILPKDPSLKYTPTSVIYVKIPRLSKFQWHPFSVTSSSNIEDDVMSLLIKCEGDWTTSLYNMIQAEINSGYEHMICIPTEIEGPYGPPSLEFLRHDSLLLIAGGIGMTPFLSIIREIASFQSSNKYRFPKKIQLIYVVKKSQDICLLNSISSLLLNQSSKQPLNLNLKVFVTREQTCNATLNELISDLSLVRKVNFSTKCSKYAIHGLESPLWMAAFTALTSIVFFVSLTCFNHVFVASEKKISVSEKLVVGSEKKADKEKTSSSIVDILLLCSFIIAITCSSIVAIVLRWKRLKKQIAEKPGKLTDSSSVLETRCGVEEHEIHFGGRPNFQDVLSKFASESGGSDIGVLVCGPETMKESVASLCQLQLQGFKGNKPYFSFHSLDFSF